MNERVQSGPMKRVTETYAIIFADTFTVGVDAQQVYVPAPPARRLEAYTTLVQAHPDNAGNVLIGNAANHVIILVAGDSMTIAADPSTIYVRGSAAGQVVNWIALR